MLIDLWRCLCLGSMIKLLFFKSNFSSKKIKFRRFFCKERIRCNLFLLGLMWIDKAIWWPLYRQIIQNVYDFFAYNVKLIQFELIAWMFSARPHKIRASECRQHASCHTRTQYTLFFVLHHRVYDTRYKQWGTIYYLTLKR